MIQKEKLIRRNVLIGENQLKRLLEAKKKLGYSTSALIRMGIDKILEEGAK